MNGIKYKSITSEVNANFLNFKSQCHFYTVINIVENHKLRKNDICCTRTYIVMISNGYFAIRNLRNFSSYQ